MTNNDVKERLKSLEQQRTGCRGESWSPTFWKHLVHKRIFNGEDVRQYQVSDLP